MSQKSPARDEDDDGAVPKQLGTCIEKSLRKELVLIAMLVGIGDAVYGFSGDGQ